MSVSVLLLSLFVRNSASVHPHVFKFFGVQRASAMEVNPHVRLQSTVILRIASFHQHRIFLSPCNIVTNYRGTRFVFLRAPILKERNWIKVSYGYLKRRIGQWKKSTANSRQKKEKKNKSTAQQQSIFESEVGAGVPASLHEKRVIACTKNRSCTLSSSSETSPMERCHPGNFLVTWCQRTFRQRPKLRRNLRTQCSLLLGCVSAHLHGGRRLRCVWWALLNEVRQQGAHSPNCCVTECDGYSERRLSSSRITQHVYVRNECERLFIEMSLMKESKAECAIVCAHFQPIEVCERNALSGFRAHPNIPIQRRHLYLI